MTDKLILGGHEFTSRFILGSGKYSLDLINAAVQNAAPWAKSRAPFALCLASAALSALLRVFFAILLAG